MELLGEDFDVDDEVLLINETGLPDEQVLTEMRKQHPELAAIRKWTKDFTGSSVRRNKNSTVFNQDRFSLPDNIFDQFRVADDAVKTDDIVSNAVEITEKIAFKRVGIETGEHEMNDIGNQIVDNMNLASKMREIWRELFTISQCYVGVLWERKDFKVKSKTSSGKASKKVYKNLLVPRGLSVLDPLKVIPVGNFMFGQEDLVYIADQPEVRQFDEFLAAENTTDLIVQAMISGKYQADPDELADLQELTGSNDLANRLYVLNPDNVFRITSTRPDYKRFADVRMMSVMEPLDLKHNLRESDRSDILGNLHCIVLVKKGSEQNPAKREELQQTAVQMQQSARVPLIISDHTMEIEIISKKMDKTLQPERYNALNQQIASRLFMVLGVGGYSSGTPVDDSTKLFKVISSTMEARRDDIREAIMDRIVEKIWEKNTNLSGDPQIEFFPRRIALDFDNNYATLLHLLFSTGDVSRETMLSELDIDQDVEALRREREDADYSEIFIPKLLPGQGVLGPVGQMGGGNFNGGGMNSESGKPTPNDETKPKVGKKLELN
jgi:hypothetical protein